MNRYDPIYRPQGDLGKGSYFWWGFVAGIVVITWALILGHLVARIF